MRQPVVLSIIAAVALSACQPAPPTKPASQPMPSDTKRGAVTALTYPVAKTIAQTDDYHGIKVADPYRWMEDLDAPATRDWIEAENKVTSAYLDAIPGKDKIKNRLTEIWNYERFGSPQQYGGNYFYTHNDGLQNQAVLYVADSLAAAPRLLLDPNTLSADGTIALKGYAISDDGKYIAYGLSSGGSDWEDWHVLDVASGKNTDDELHWVKFSGASWRRDGTGFYYSRYDEPRGENALKAVSKFQKLYFHRLGTKQSDDLLIHEQKDQPDWLFSAQVSDDGRYLVISVARSTEPKNLVLFRDLAKKHADAKTETLIGAWDASYQFLGNTKDVFYFLTDSDAPRYRIIAVETKHPDKAHWKELVPQGAETLQNASIVNHSFIAEYLQDAHSNVHLFDLKGKAIGDLVLPGLGSASGFSGRTRDTETFYTYSSYTAAPTVFRYDLKTSTGSVFRAPKVAFDSAQYETRQVFYPSKDGTRVPMFVTAKKGVAQNGANPTILYGYGGFNVSLQPAFSSVIDRLARSRRRVRGGEPARRRRVRARVARSRHETAEAERVRRLHRRRGVPNQGKVYFCAESCDPRWFERRAARRRRRIAASGSFRRRNSPGRCARHAALPRLHDRQGVGIGLRLGRQCRRVQGDVCVLAAAQHQVRRELSGDADHYRRP